MSTDEGVRDGVRRGRPAKPTPAHELLERLHTLVHAFRRAMHEPARDGEPGVAPMEARALAYFTRHPAHTQRDLAAHTGRDKAQIARIVGPLVERGLLAAEPDPEDRRSQRLQPTEAGLAMQRRMQQHRARFETRLLRGLGDDERLALLAQLDRLIANVGTGAGVGAGVAAGASVGGSAGAGAGAGGIAHAEADPKAAGTPSTGAAAPRRRNVSPRAADMPIEPTGRRRGRTISRS